MKYFLQLSVVAFTAMLFFTNAKAQSVYWREGFTTWDGPTADPGVAATTGTATGDAGLWGYYAIWRTTGTGCPYTDATPNPHIRSTSAAITGTGATTDTAYLVTPAVTNGISSVSLIRSRMNRRVSFYWTPDASITTTNWIFSTSTVKNASFPVLCTDSLILINQPTARRLQIRFEKAGNFDVDSIILISSTPLPVTLNNLKAVQKANGIQVEWSNATESNVSRYAVERSADGRVFAEIGSVNAMYNHFAVASYSYIDALPLNGNNLYRVKAYEKDGSATYTGIVKVNAGKKNMSLSVMPNPVKGKTLNIQLSNAGKGTYTLQLFNGIGQRFYSTSIMYDGGDAAYKLQLPAALKAGVYNLQLTDGSNVINRKISVE